VIKAAGCTCLFDIRLHSMKYIKIIPIACVQTGLSSFRHHFQAVFGAHPTSYPLATGVCSHPTSYPLATGVCSHPASYPMATGVCSHPASCPMGTGGPFPGVKRDRGVMLITHPHLVPRLRMIRSNTSSPPRRLHGV
jgi:hypothetical protein